MGPTKVPRLYVLCHLNKSLLYQHHNIIFLLPLLTTNLSFNLILEITVNPITGCFFGSGGYQATVWCCHEQTTTKSDFWGIVGIKFIILGL